MEHKILVDRSSCIGCGACVKDCPEMNLFLNEEKKAVVKSQECMKCGHCSAICPKHAIHLTGFQEEPVSLKDLKKIDPKDLMDALLRRRSIRQFQSTPVSEEELHQIIEAGRISPTGKNSQAVTFVVIDHDKQELEQIAVSFFQKLLKTMNVFSKSYRDFEIDEHFFFKQAPLAIAIYADNDVNGTIAAANMALMAESLGLGVLYSGFFTLVLRYSKTMKQHLSIRKQKPVTTLVIGRPAVTYQRTTQKDVANVIYR